MDLDYQKIYHNYITRLVIFAIFLYKEHRRDDLVYTEYVNKFIIRRINQDLNLLIVVGPKLEKLEVRDLAIDIIFDDVPEDASILNLVFVIFKTGLKEMNLQIDINDEEKYRNYLYS